MRDNFETLVQQLLEGDFSANQTFIKLFSDSYYNYTQQLTDEEIRYLQNATEQKESNDVTYYVQGCLCQLKKKDPQAIELYEKAIALDNSYAMTNRAFMHQHGPGGTIDYPQAAKLYRNAALINPSEPAHID